MAAAWAVAYLACALVVFDFRDMAQPWDEENFGNRAVAVGPRPRWPFCRPERTGGYDPDAWPFRVWAPVCQGWRHARGYAAPDRIRGTRWE